MTTFRSNQRTSQWDSLYITKEDLAEVEDDEYDD